MRTLWGIVALLLLAGCGPEETSSDPPDPRAGIVGTGGLSTPRTGPATAQAGESHHIDVLTHCGLEFLRFGDRTWRADTPLPEPKQRPAPNGVHRYDGYTSGTITVVDDQTLSFAVDNARFEAPPEPLVFRPTTAEPPLCQ